MIERLPNNKLRIRVDDNIRALFASDRASSQDAMYMRREDDVIEAIETATSYERIWPEDIGALTDAPIIGLRDEAGNVTEAWGFMAYALRSFVDDLIDDGYCDWEYGNTVPTDPLSTEATS